MRRTQEEINLHNQKIMNFLNNDRKSLKQFCNRTLSSQGENFAINDGVLASMSGFFKAMFNAEMKEKYESSIKLDTISPKRLETILDFIYTGDVELTDENVWAVLEDSDYTQTEDLKSFCSKFMFENVKIGSCLKLREYAARYKLDDVEKKTNKMIADNIAAVVQHHDFQELDFDDMSEIIKLREKDCEEAVFSAIVKWVNYNPHQREELFVKLFSQLDLSLMTTDFLQQVSNENLVKTNLECLNMLVQMYVRKQTTSNTDSGTKFLLIGSDDGKCIAYDVTTKQARHSPSLVSFRRGLTSTRVGRKVYVMGGDGKKCKVLDLDENTWNEIPDMLEERQFCGSASVGDCIYLTGSGEYGESCEKFDITNNKWEKMKDMLNGRACHASVVCNNLLYCIGGYGDDDRLKSCERYDVEEDEWNEIATLNEARADLACVVLNGNIFAIGGDDDNDKALSTVERYKPETNKWEYVSSLKTARCGHSACVVGNKIYAIGGCDSNDDDLTSVEVYDPTSDTWEFSFDLERSFFSGSVVSL